MKSADITERLYVSGYVGKKTMEYDRNQLDLNGCFLSFFMEPQMIKSNAANGSAYSFLQKRYCCVF